MQYPELNDAHYAQLDARIGGSEGWKLRATRRITHSIAGFEGVERLQVKGTRLLTHKCSQHCQCSGSHETRSVKAKHGWGQ